MYTIRTLDADETRLGGMNIGHLHVCPHRHKCQAAFQFCFLSFCARFFLTPCWFDAQAYVFIQVPMVFCVTASKLLSSTACSYVWNLWKRGKI